MGAVTHSNVDDVFSYHKPKGDFQIEKYHRVRTAAKDCAKAVLDTPDTEPRLTALRLLRERLELEMGECRDRHEALGMLDAAEAFVRGIGAVLRGEDSQDPDAQSEATQAVIQCIRAAVMWTNASVALEGRI